MKIRGSTQILDATVTSTQVDSTIIIAAGSNAFTGNQSMGGFKLTSLGTPTVSTDAATKAYVDSVATGMDVKASVRVATAAALPAHTRSGNTLTASANGALSVDGVSVAVSDRVLVKDEGSGTHLENGLYTVTATGGAGAAWVLDRATDADSSAEVTAGLFTWVAEGTVNADSAWVLVTNDAITLNTTALTFQQFSGAGQITAGAGLTKTGNTLDVVAADTSITVNADSIQVNVGDASLEVSSGLRVTHGTAGQVYIAGAGGVCTPTTLSGDVLSVSAAGVVALATTVMKTGNYIVRETPSGTVNGSNAVFTLANTPVAGTDQVYLNGILQDAGGGNDYTISSATITFATAPQSGDKVRVTYMK